MRKISFVTMLCASLMCMGLFSCGEDEVITEQPEPTPEEPVPDPDPDPEPGQEEVRYVDIDYVLNCSEDLLEYATPQVTYVDEDGREVTVQIADSEWEVDEDVTFDVTFNDASFDAKILRWTKRIHREEFPVDAGVSVVYIPKADMPEYDEEKVNLFYRDLWISNQFVDEENNLTTPGGEKGGDSSLTIDVTLEEVLDRGLPYVLGVGGGSVVIGTTNETIEKLINLYQAKKVIHVGSDGTYSIKEEEMQAEENIPYVDIVYTLNCSADFLKYVTPQVTYTGDDGNPVTYQIDESEFELNEEITKWAEHSHGDETVGNGEEDARIMKWTKRVRYEDFQAVDDKMIVTYIPKEGYDGGLLLGHLFHNLSAAFSLSDDKGENTVFLSANTIDSNIVAGQPDTPLSIAGVDANGTPYLDNFLLTSFIPEVIATIQGVDSNGEPYLYTFTFADFMEQYKDLYTDFQGYHIEKDGTYEMLTE